MEIVRETVAFAQEDGYRLVGTVYQPSAALPSMAIVFCHGYGGTRAYIAPEIASGLAARTGGAVLAFDYSGFGDSEGPEGRLDPYRQAADVSAAVSFLQGRLLQADPGRGTPSIGLYGTSFGSPIAVVAAAQDPRVRAVVAVSGFPSGRRWMRDLRRHWEWIEFQEELARDRARRAGGEPSKMIEPDWIMPRDPESAAFNAQLLAEHPERVFSLDVRSAELIDGFEPIAWAPRLVGHTPALFVHAERDLLMPLEYVFDLAQAAGGDIAVLPGLGHYDVYAGQPLEDVLDRAAAWYRRHLAAPDRSDP